MRLREHPRRVAVLQAVAAGVVYLALACLPYWPVSPFDPTHLVGDRVYSDAVQQAWFLQWVAFALGHGQNPLFSTYLNAPAGVNLAVNTSMPLLGFLGWPVTALSGVTVPSGRVSVICDHVTAPLAVSEKEDSDGTVEPSVGVVETRVGAAAAGVVAVVAGAAETAAVLFVTEVVNALTGFPAASWSAFKTGTA